MGNTKSSKLLAVAEVSRRFKNCYFLENRKIERLKAQGKLFVSENDFDVEQLFETLGNASIKIVGPEIIFEKIYDGIGFNEINEDLFRHLVIARLAFPLNKLKTIGYLCRFQWIRLDVDAVYRFLNKPMTV